MARVQQQRWDHMTTRKMLYDTGKARIRDGACVVWSLHQERPVCRSSNLARQAKVLSQKGCGSGQ